MLGTTASRTACVTHQAFPELIRAFRAAHFKPSAFDAVILPSEIGLIPSTKAPAVSAHSGPVFKN